MATFKIFLTLASLLLGAAVLNAETTTPKPHTNRGPHRTVCYTAGWATGRPSPVQFEPEDVDTRLCSILIFAFAGLDNTGLIVQPNEPTDTQLYARLTNLKRERPSLKVMLGIGGWTMGSDEFTQTVSSTGNMNAFAANVIEFLHRYNFDGLDVDWEYPADRGSPPGDKQQFTILMKTLRNTFNRDHHNTNRTRLMLSAAVSPAPSRIQTSYELTEVANYVDFLNLMTYDMHGPWDHVVGHHSTLYSPNGDPTDSVDYVINWILNTTIPPAKLNLGLAFYGHSLNLTDASQHALGDPITGTAPGGSILHDNGIFAYYEVCKLLNEQNDTITEQGRLSGTTAPYVIHHGRWIGYDDEQSIREKVDYAVQKGLGGVFIWSIDMDDFHGICGGGHNPLLHAIADQMHQSLHGLVG